MRDEKMRALLLVVCLIAGGVSSCRSSRPADRIAGRWKLAGGDVVLEFQPGGTLIYSSTVVGAGQERAKYEFLSDNRIMLHGRAGEVLPETEIYLVEISEDGKTLTLRSDGSGSNALRYEKLN